MKGGELHILRIDRGQTIKRKVNNGRTNGKESKLKGKGRQTQGKVPPLPPPKKPTQLKCVCGRV